MPFVNKTPAPGTAFRFATKAGTLERLAPYVNGARLCEQITVAVADWGSRRDDVAGDIVARFAPRRLAVRSSAASEDGWNASQAGAHLSLIDVAPERQGVAAAIDAVFASYRHPATADQVLVQPMVEGAVISGVVLTRELDTGGPYYVVNYDDVTGRTDTVTGGAESKTILVHRARPDALKSPRFRRLIESVRELESITGSHALDIEFCITADDQVYVLQVRPLAARRRWQPIPDGAVDTALDDIRAVIAERMAPRPGLAGATTILGEMPDWNPAEMIGNAPRPLALSLYRRLITDQVWADARAAMGYRRVEAPLLVDFHGRPYVDVRLSLNSFLPADTGEGLAHRLVDWQLSELARRPQLHDKIEFEIAATCRDFAFAAHARRLRECGLGAGDVAAFETSLARLTGDALAAQPAGLASLAALTGRLMNPLGDRRSPPKTRVRALLRDCKVHGTLPFATLARHGFIGVSFLRSLVRRGVLGQTDADRFMRAIHTVASDLVHDMHALGAGRLEEAAFLVRYGHLRPGTYDVTSWRYDERPGLFLGQAGGEAPPPQDPFEASPAQRAGIAALIDESGYGLEPDGLLGYIAGAVKAREAAKFAFTRSISGALSILVEWGARIGLDREDLSFLPIATILEDHDVRELRERIAEARQAYAVTRSIRLPHLIVEAADIDVVRLPLGQPTFITGQAVTAPAARLASADPPAIAGRIVLIESADPGFDWIFSHRIAGLITKYGGANSHMAVRCAEFGLPAAIGCGERLFETLAGMSVIELNCAARRITGH